MRIKQLFILTGVLIGVLGIAATWSAMWMNGRRADAAYISGDLQRSMALAEQITQLKAQPTIALAEDMGIRELDPKIETALKAAGLPRRPTIEGIFPQAAYALGGLPYQIKPTGVSIRNVSLGQLLAFLYYLTDRTGLNVRDLRLRAARSGDATRWDAEATITYLIYSPSDDR